MSWNYDAKSAHDVVAVKTETETQKQPSNDKKPDGGRKSSIDAANTVGFVDRSPGPDSVGHIVGTIGDRHHNRGDHLAHTNISGEGRGGHNGSTKNT